MTGKVLITGGQQGIGLGIAQALHATGWEVALAAELSPQADTVKAALASMPGTTYHQHDVTDIASIAALLAEVGPLRSLVSNAGVPAMMRGDLLDVAASSFDRCMDVNLRGAFFLAQAVARGMLEQPPAPYRSMIFITSVSAAMRSASCGGLLMLAGGCVVVGDVVA